MVPVYYTLSFAFVTSRADDPQITEWAFSAARGDRAALEAFIRATQADVWRFVCYLADAGRADDLTQETFIRAMKSLPRFSGRASARTWLLSIARRVVVDQIRHDSSRPRLVAETDEQRIENPQRHEEQVELMMLIGALDTDRREALLLTQVMGLSYSEAAQVCDCPIGTIRSRVARARDELQAAHRADDHAV